MPAGALHWCFTYPARDAETPPPLFIAEHMQYLIFQKERGEGENSYEHYQGYVKFKAKKVLRWITAHIWTGSRTHWEVKRGTVEQAIDYCSKEETRLAGPFEFGEKPFEKGARTDLAELEKDIKTGTFSKKQIIEKHTQQYFKYHGGIDKVICALKVIPEEKPICLLFHGDSRVGKTTLAKSFGASTYMMPLGASTPWFDGKYDTQETILVEEFKGQWDLTWMKLFLDSRDCPLLTKGGFTSNASKYIIITSNTDPRYWYPNMSLVDWKALAWRFASIVKCIGPNWQNRQMFRDDNMDYYDPDFYKRDPFYIDPLVYVNPENVS